MLGAAVLLQDVTRFHLLDQVKSNLVATVSHELKTPLTSIGLAVHLLLEEAAGPLTPKQTELLIDARENSERLLATINNLLGPDAIRRRAAAAGSSNRDRRPNCCRRPPTWCARASKTSKSRSRLTCRTTRCRMVDVDVARLPMRCDNLVDNAITYTRRGGRIMLSAPRPWARMSR